MPQLTVSWETACGGHLDLPPVVPAPCSMLFVFTGFYSCGFSPHCRLQPPGVFSNCRDTKPVVIGDKGHFAQCDPFGKVAWHGSCMVVAPHSKLSSIKWLMMWSSCHTESFSKKKCLGRCGRRPPGRVQSTWWSWHVHEALAHGVGFILSPQRPKAWEAAHTNGATWGVTIRQRQFLAISMWQPHGGKQQLIPQAPQHFF